MHSGFYFARTSDVILPELLKSLGVICFMLLCDFLVFCYFVTETRSLFLILGVLVTASPLILLIIKELAFAAFSFLCKPSAFQLASLFWLTLAVLPCPRHHPKTHVDMHDFGEIPNANKSDDCANQNNLL